METFIPIIIAIVVFAFQAYANYQKEQDKARKRNPAQPPLESLPPLPEDNAKHIQPVPLPAPVTSSATRPEFERYSGMVDPVRSTPTRRSHERPLIPQRLAVETETDVQPDMDAETFDLRDAVIKSIILDRPYK